MAKKNKRRSLQEIAEANANLRYGPESSALQALVGQATEDYRTDVRSAGAMARTVARGARKSRPLLHKIYSQAASGVKAAQEDIDAAFNQAGVTPDNAFRIASETEGTAYRQKMTAESAAARRETVRQVHDARLGKIFAVGAAKDKLNSTVGQLQQRATDLLGERQSFLTSELGRMQGERADRRNALKVTRIQNQLDPNTGKPLVTNPFKPATRSEGKEFTSDLARALDLSPDYAKANIGRDAAAKELRSGVKASGKGANRDPGFSKIKDPLAVKAALDMAYRGSVSAKTRKELLERGFRPAELDGVRYIRNKKRRQTEAGRRAAQQPGGTIPGVGNIIGLGV